MPIYEYKCGKCAHEFELLVRGTMVPKCEKCGSDQVERLLSLPSIKSETTRGLAMKAARRRDKAQGQERESAQREYEAHHDD
jgi:putative FmdB family regulatory protein